MENLSNIFLEVAQKRMPVSKLIEGLLDIEGYEQLDQSTRLAYQAFCCALLAKEDRKLMQKAQYVNEYWEFIHQALLIDGNSTIGHLIRLMVEKQLDNVNFESHIQADLAFMMNVVNDIQDTALKELIEKVITT